MESQAQQFGMGDLFRSLLANHGSDLHVTAGSPPRIRINGVLRPLNVRSLTPDDVKRLIHSILSPDQRVKLEWDKELNTALGISGIGRFRVNVFYQRSSLGAVFRNIPHEVPTFKALGLPVPPFEHACLLPKGLVILAGPSRSGKSTTLAAMINHLNDRDECHIVTVEDPIEFLHRNRRSLVNQREVGHDSHSFAAALRHAVLQDPDIVAISDVRDRETLEQALGLCETGHLVLATMAAADVVQAVQTMVGFFPADGQAAFLARLSVVLEMIIAQQLVTRKDEDELVPVLEICVATAGVRGILRDNKLAQLYTAMQTGVRDGMSTMNNALQHLVSAETVTGETALAHSTRPEEMQELLDAVALQQNGRKSRATTRIW